MRLPEGLREMRPEKTDHGLKKDILEGSPALQSRAEMVMIEAAEQAVRERRDPSRMLRVLALLASPVYDPDNPETTPVHLDL